MDLELNFKKNLKLFPIYKMFSWDLLFYYAIIFLFLTKTKNLSASEILFADAFYPVFKFIFQIFCINITDNIGYRKSILIGNIFVSSAILSLLFCEGVNGVIFVNFLLAIGFNLKELCEPPFLNSSISNEEKKREIFSRIDGIGSSHFYFLDAISAALTGFLFAFNNYLPIIFCFVFSLTGTIISFTFEETENSKKRTLFPSRNNVSTFIKNLSYAFKHIFKSGRLRCLILFSALFASLISVFRTYMNSLFVDLNLPDIYFGIITAGIQIVSAFSSKHQNYFHKKYKNRVLTVFSIPLSISMIIAGLVVVCHFPAFFVYIGVACMVLFYALFKGPYYTLIKRYLSSFVSLSISVKIYAVNSMCDSVLRSLTFLFSSFLLSFTNTASAIIILGLLFLIAFVLLLDYMKSRVGLKPDEYKKSDIQIGVS